MTQVGFLSGPTARTPLPVAPEGRAPGKPWAGDRAALRRPRPASGLCPSCTNGITAASGAEHGVRGCRTRCGKRGSPGPGRNALFQRNRESADRGESRAGKTNPACLVCQNKVEWFSQTGPLLVRAPAKDFCRIYSQRPGELSGRAWVP